MYESVYSTILKPLFFPCSVPTFHGLQEDILSKLADVLEEVTALFHSVQHLQHKAIHTPYINVLFSQ